MKGQLLKCVFLIAIGCVTVHGWIPSSRRISRARHNTRSHHVSRFASSIKPDDDNTMDFPSRRTLWLQTARRMASMGLGAMALAVWTRPSWASSRSRTEGYAVQHTDAEWKELLSPVQYQILRLGGTEKPYYSILEGEERPGVFKCAGCGSELFSAKDKFHSGTGWPSFARGLPAVEVERVDPITANLAGAELRCGTCGGHLGDVFQDGFLFQGTEAAVTGKRFCIDGAALIFYPQSGEASVRGDLPSSKPQSEPNVPSGLEPPTITPRE